MAAPAPVFTDSFLVEERTQSYGAFIGIVRQNVIRYCADRRPKIVQPVLPPEEKTPRLWFHIVLTTKKTRSLTLAIRMDNLYLVGFRTPAGVWWEFNNEQNTHLISGAKWLGFGGRYQDLIGQKGLETVTLGRSQMTTAVDALANHGTAAAKMLLEEEELQAAAAADPYAVPKAMLAKLVIMICEGLRFLTVSGTVEKGFESPAATVTALEGKQVNKWDRISAAVFKWADDPNAAFPDLVQVGVRDKNDAAKIVALVKHQK